MSRYIDTDEWCEDCKEYDKEHHNCPRFNRVIRTAFEDADMVRVVRCKECYMCDEEMWCSFYDSIMESDDYCSYGERKSDE